MEVMASAVIKCLAGKGYTPNDIVSTTLVSHTDHSHAKFDGPDWLNLSLYNRPDSDGWDFYGSKIKLRDGSTITREVYDSPPFQGWEFI